MSSRWKTVLPLVWFFWCSAGALQFLSFPAAASSLALAWIAPWFAFRALPSLGWNRSTFLLAALAFLPLWLAGLDSPYHWDEVYTSVRAQALWHTGALERLSLLYVLLAPFAGVFSTTSTLVHVVVAGLGLLTLAGLGLCIILVAGRVWAARLLPVVAALPPIFLIFRWALSDTLLLALWTWTLAAALAWSRRLTIPRVLTLCLLVVGATLTKETGGLILFPVAAALIARAPRGRAARRFLALTLLFALASAMAFAVLHRYAHLRHINSFFRGVKDSYAGVTFLPFNHQLPHPWQSYLRGLARQTGLLWMQTGLVIPAILAVLRPRNPRAAALLVGIGALVQILWILLSAPHTWGDVYTYPVYALSHQPHEFTPLSVFVLAVVALWIFRAIRLRIDSLSIIALAAIVPGTLALLAFAKTNPDGQGGLAVWLEWRYALPMLAVGVVLAARGIRLAARWSIPILVRYFALIVILFFVVSSVLHAVGVACRLRSVDRVRAESYAFLRQRSERVIYTHWPFVYLYEDKEVFDNGPLAWRRDGWDVRWIWGLPEDAGAIPTRSLLLWDIYRSYGLPLEKLARLSTEIRVFPATVWRMGILSFRMSPQRLPAVVVASVAEPIAGNIELQADASSRHPDPQP